MAVKELYLPRHGLTPRALPAEDQAAQPGPGAWSSLALLALLDLSILGHGFLACRLVSLVLVLVLPGTLVAGRLRLHCHSLMLRMGTVLGFSCAVLMAWGLLASWLLPEVGVGHPLGTVPSAVGLNVIILGLVAACAKVPDPVEVIWAARRRLSADLALLVLPLLSIAGVERLNSGHGSALTQVVMCSAVVLFCLGLRRAGTDEGGSALILFVASLSLLYLYSYRGAGLFGYDIQQEYQRFRVTYQAQRWVPPSNGDPYAAMLSITALPTVLSRVTGVSGEYLFRGLYPVLTAFIPAFSYSFARRWLPGRAAYVGAGFMVVLADFASQLPALARQEMGLFFFALLLWVMFGYVFSGRNRRVATVVLMAALVVSHYSSSYVAVTLLAATWVAYGLARLAMRALRPGRPVAKPVASLWLVLAMLGMVVAWDSGVTHSSSNVTQFVSSLANNGLDILPNAKSGSLIERYLKGNEQASLTPAQYYHDTEVAAHRSQPWLEPFPQAVVNRYHASPAPAVPEVKARLAGVAGPLSSALTIADELFLLAMCLGALLVVARAVRGKRSGPPLEVGVLALATVGFLALVRLSGTVDAAYNSDRAELQAAIVLSVGLGAVVAFVAKRAPFVVWAVMAALALTLITNVGETNQVLGGPAQVTNSNSGFDYEMFVVQQQEISAARWMVSSAGPNALYYADDVGMLRVWDATAYAPRPQAWLTPGALDRRAWVYVSEHNIVDHTAFGSVDGRTTTYRFPAQFLSDQYNRVYTSPQTAVYH